MSDWIAWLTIAGIVVVMELFTGTFYLLMIVVGLVAGALTAWVGWSVGLQLLTAAIIGLIATISLHRSRFGIKNKTQANRNPDLNLDIGQMIQIAAWDSNAAGVCRTRAMYRGALWDIELRGSEAPQPGNFKIIEIRGSLLVVEPDHA